MTDVTTQPVDQTAPTNTLATQPKDSFAQMIVAIVTVSCLTTIAVASLLVGWLCKSELAIATALVAVPSTVVGALANALQSPQGLNAIIAAASKKPQ